MSADIEAEPFVSGGSGNPSDIDWICLEHRHVDFVLGKDKRQ